MIATPKHFAVHSGPETTRHSVNVDATKHDMEDTYLPAFRATVTEGKARSVMCAYNRVNAEPACANAFLLEDQLRGAWKFNGYVVSDCDAVADIERGHHFTQTMAEAAAISLKRGIDNECADFGQKAVDNSDYVKYVDAVKQGLLSEKDVDVAVKRLFTARFQLGMFDPPEMVKYAQIPDSVIDSEAHRQLALKIARESMVLLKNDGALPLNAQHKKDCGGGATGRFGARARRQLQRHSVTIDHCAGRHSQTVRRRSGDLHAGHQFPARICAGAGVGAVHARRKAGPQS